MSLTGIHLALGAVVLVTGSFAAAQIRSEVRDS